VKEVRIYDTQIKYLCKKHEWNQSTVETIAWKPHRRAINRHVKKKVTIVKYLNGIIPVGKLVNRYDKKYSAQCPSCDELVETQDHLHQCTNPTREQWRVNFKTAMSQVMDKYNTPEPMVKLWLDSINKGMEDTENTIECSLELQYIVEAQEKIGWNQLMKGRIAKQWIRYQHEAMGDAATKRKNATTWATDMISTIFDRWLQLWK
jgi:hypothetical protein